MVGDSLSSDMQGGTNYGIATCWYNPDRIELPEGRAVTHQIARLDELLDLVSRPEPAARGDVRA